MIIGGKDLIKLLGISVIACCAVFVCTLFLNYNIDVAGIEDQISSEAGLVLYDALVMTGKVVAIVSGGCLAATSAVMLLSYVKNYIDSHGKELGILKALGYSDMQVAKHFWVFGMSILAGSIPGFLGAFLYMPSFYGKQNDKGFFPDIPVRFHPGLAAALLLVPPLLFALLSVLYALHKMRSPVLNLMRQTQSRRHKLRKKETKNQPFLQDLKQNTLRDRKILVFLIAFSAFCFSAMTQMSMSMDDLSSESFSWMILSIGLVLAFVTLFLSLTSVLKANTQTLAMMKVFGYSGRECRRAILGSYRPVSYIGFAVGSAYQYILLKLVVTLVFADFEGMPEFHFNLRALCISFAAFVAVYELIMYWYSVRIDRMSVKSIMIE